MKLLILNVGSSSIKYNLFNNKTQVKEGVIERVKNYEKSLKKIISEVGVIDAIGHRVVHGGNINKTCLITKKVLKQIKKFVQFAPLHNVPEIKGIEACKHLSVKQYAVFDTAFHRTMPTFVQTYAIPLTFFKNGVRRYGFHGTSHCFVAKQAALTLKKPLSKLKLITCHLGNGCSVTAIKNGKSFDTSMGFTPLEGLMMGTRSGDIDPSFPTYLMKQGWSHTKITDLLNNKSGLLAISKKHSDMRDLIKSKDSTLAIEMFVYRIIKYIGAYVAALNGVDAIVFTGGIGENVPLIRKKILDNFKYLGICINNQKNNKNSIIISAKSKIKVLVIKTNEEQMMAQEILRII